MGLNSRDKRTLPGVLKQNGQSFLLPVFPCKIAIFHPSGNF